MVADLDDVREHLNDRIDKLEAHLHATRSRLEAAVKVVEQQRETLKLVKMLLHEGGVPRYSIVPGAALNSFVEEDFEPTLQTAAAFLSPKENDDGR